MDELDSVLLTAIAESEEGSAAPMDRARAEAEMRELWARTFTAVARAQEDWLQSAFIRRGAGIVEHLYPHADERLRLYHYGFTPVIGGVLRRWLRKFAHRRSEERRGGQECVSKGQSRWWP